MIGLGGFEQTVPAMQKDGAFDYDSFMRFSQFQLGLSVKAFIDMQRRELMANRVRNLLRGGVNVSEGEVKRDFEKQGNQVNLEYVRYPFRQLRGAGGGDPGRGRGPRQDQRGPAEADLRPAEVPVRELAQGAPAAPDPGEAGRRGLARRHRRRREEGAGAGGAAEEGRGVRRGGPGQLGRRPQQGAGRAGRLAPAGGDHAGSGQRGEGVGRQGRRGDWPAEGGRRLLCRPARGHARGQHHLRAGEAGAGRDRAAPGARQGARPRPTPTPRWRRPRRPRTRR